MSPLAFIRFLSLKCGFFERAVPVTASTSGCSCACVAEAVYALHLGI
jgi:hypothetical protein